ncbi:hypothetical protein GALMADRAFT_133857 [Galerina marginata CBS 339.88]|uniref:Uncharacterized protein n=1 Tax=Galerina marginata (strain CBS 339.88) TaxID=685588 RepID=A0A067TQJ3_GALM3|nr:hypothetical protein GALMADRAFT_133857 [Galerina marginata CBS 339.88]
MILITENAGSQIKRHQHWLILVSTTTTDFPSLPLGPSCPSTPQEHVCYTMHVQHRAARREPPLTSRAVGRRSNEYRSPPPPFRPHETPATSRRSSSTTAAARTTRVLRVRKQQQQKHQHCCCSARVTWLVSRGGNDIRCLFTLTSRNTPLAFLALVATSLARCPSTLPRTIGVSPVDTASTYMAIPEAHSPFAPLTTAKGEHEPQRTKANATAFPTFSHCPLLTAPADVSQPAVHVTRGL